MHIFNLPIQHTAHKNRIQKHTMLVWPESPRSHCRKPENYPNQSCPQMVPSMWN